jgi:predicted methyltransferase
MDNFIKQIKTYNPELSLAEIEGILFILKNNEKIKNNDLISLTRLPKETLRVFKKSISNFLTKDKDDSVSLNEDGLKILTEYNLRPHMWSLSEGLNFSDQESLNKIREIKDKYSPKPKREFDQFLATPETTYLKSEILIKKGFVKNMNIAFIGDDDLNSISLASIDRSYNSITLFDIDEDILNSIQEYSESTGLENLKVVKYDVRSSLSKEYYGKFDIVVFDPPYTKSGVTVFLERALWLLGNISNGERKYIVMYYGNSFKSPEKTLKIQELINVFDLSIEDRIEKFAQYSGAESIGNASSLYILSTNKFTNVPVSSVGNIYTFEKESEEKFPFVDHVVFKIFGVDKSLLVSRGRLLNAVENLCKTHRLKVVDKKVTEFKGGGFTISFILSNSNITIHTWPEFNAVHVDLITCSPIYNKNVLASTLSKEFNTKKIDTFFIE